MGLPNIGPVELLIFFVPAVVVVALLVARFRSGQAKNAIPDPLPPDIARAEVVVRIHRSLARDRAIDWYKADLDLMVDAGYLPATQVWQPGKWGALDFLIALLLMPLGIGVIVALYFFITRPPGTMMVTYVRRDTGKA